MRNRIVRVLLCAVLLCGMLTPCALAAEEGYDPEDPLYEKMMEAMAAYVWSDMPTFSDFRPRERETETVHPGVDVSSWQGSINWDKVAAAGVEFAFIRGAYRGTTAGALGKDVRFETYIEDAQAAGIPVGVYIYSQAITVEEGIEEAEFLLELVAGYDIDLPLVIDYEYANGKGRLYEANLTDRERTDICLAFCETVEAAGYEAMVYANASMLRDDMYAGELPRVWLAHYAEETGYAGEYEYWQCSDKGTVDGIGGSVDLDFWFKSAPEQSEPDEPVIPALSPFEDVTESDWFFSSVMQAYKAGIVNGLGAGLFGPDSPARRGQVVTMLHRIQGEPAAAQAAPFVDLTEEYYKDAIAWAAENGVVTGISETEFFPNGLITRQDLVTIFYRLEGSPAVSGDLTAYADGDNVREYARDAMIWAVEAGILTGYEDNTLRPMKTASRAEVCAIFMRYTALSGAGESA